MHTRNYAPTVNNAQASGDLGIEAAYLDTRYLAMQPEYEAMLRGVGIVPGWHVLDAGCGGGSHLPLLSALVGAGGRVHALDRAVENIAAADRLAQTRLLRSPLETHLNSVLDLPLPSNSVDAVWNANVSQYLTDGELQTMLGEFQRVTRPGGLVAIKEIDATLFQVRPIPHRCFWRLFDATLRAGVLQPSGALRTQHLPRFMADAGFSAITARPVLITRQAPLRPVERESCTAILQLLLAFARQAGVGDEELGRWRGYADPESPTFVLDDPALLWCETQMVVVGRVPVAR